MKNLILAFTLIFGSSAMAYSHLEGTWFGKDGKQIELIEFDGTLSIHTRSYYSNGAPSDYFFEFQIAQDREVQAGEIIEGRLRSIDGYYGCLFDQPAKMTLDYDGRLKMNFPLLAFHREIRSVRDEEGSVYRRQIDWTRWGYIERIYNFPIYRWRVVSNNCVIDKAIPTTSTLSR
jgi:hypothetical protein